MHYFLFIAILLNFQIQSLFAQDAASQDIDVVAVRQSLPLNDAQFHQKLDDLLPDEFLLASITYDLPCPFDRSELEYLTGLPEGKSMGKQDLFNALFYLEQSQKYMVSHIDVAANNQGYDLVLHMIKNPVLHRVVVTGFLRGKDRLKNSYLLDIGEFFDEQKHRHSLDQILHVLKDAGYFQAQIIDTVTIDPITKGVVVGLVIKKGSKFQVRNVEIVFDHIGTVGCDDVAKLQQRIQDLHAAKLVGKNYSSDLIVALRHKVQHLLEHRGCIDCEIAIKQELLQQSKQVDVTVHVSMERKREFVFWGASFFTSEQLIENLLLYGKSTWHFPGSLIVDEVEQLYKNKGFWDVHVSVREEKDRVFCFIQEGTRTVINSVQFLQNHHLSQATSLKQACTQLLKAKYFDRELFKKTSERVVKVYKQAGFWDIKIIKDEFVATKKEHVVDLVLTLDEGSKRVLQSITVPGYPDIEQQILALWARSFNSGFDLTVLQDQRQWIHRYLRNKGYQKVSVEYVLSQDADAMSVVWNIGLSESAVKMGKAIIVGNCKIPHKLIMQEVAYEHGDVWDKNKIETTLQNLRSLSVFDSVHVFPGRELDQDLYKPVFIKLVEDDGYEIRTRFGLQQTGRNLQLRPGFTYKLGGTVSIKNPFRVADTCLFEADATSFYRNIAASYEFPWLMGRKIRCQLKAYDILYQQPVYIGSDNFLYKTTQQGFLWNMAHNRNTKNGGLLTTSGSVGLEFLGISQADQPNLDTIIHYDQSLLGKKTAYIFAEPTLLWQKIDSLINPRRGYKSFLSCKGMLDLDTKTSFFKVLVEHTHYIPFSDTLTVAVRARCGHVFNRSFEQINPIERFYLGGACSLRGYERDYCPPFGLLTEPIHDQHAGLPAAAQDYWKYAPQGGRTMFNLSIEFRAAVYKNFGVVLFNDMGALFQHSIYDEMKNRSDNFFAGSGVGFRYETPIGPLRFDIGFKWKLDNPDFELRCVRYLTIGQSF